jgi:hypothetical protein
MKKNGPQDVAYAVVYDAKDSDYITSLDPDSLMSLILKKWNDHHPSIFTGISKADDIITYPGLSFCMQQILGLTVVRWRYMAVGTGTTQARPYQQGLEAEVFPRADMTSIGSMTRSGQSLRFLATFPASSPTITVRESAVTQAVSGTSIFLNRNQFSITPVSHTVNVSAYTIASLITFSAVTTWG